MCVEMHQQRSYIFIQIVNIKDILGPYIFNTPSQYILTETN